MGWLWNKKENAFYHSSLIGEYPDVSIDDTVGVDDSVFDEFSISPNMEGKIRKVGADGMPAWIDPPPPTHEEEVASAEIKKASLIREVSEEIQILADAVDLGMATTEEEARYANLRRYRVELNRVDTSTAPKIKWPVKP